MGARILRGVPEASETWAGLGSRLEGTAFTEVRHLDEVDSTNRYVLEEARRGAPEGLVVVADHQTAGRGRLGRAWTAPPRSSLLTSVLLRPDLAPDRTHLVLMAAGVAACEAVFLAAGFAPSLKWPNDLVVGDRKLAGMLTEADLGGGRLRAVVLGLGLNVNWEADWDELPPELAETATSCDLVAGERCDRVEVLARFLERLDVHYATLASPGGGSAIAGEYRARCSTVGRRVRVDFGDEALDAEATGVDEDGRLRVRGDDGFETAVAAGDVVHLRPRSGT